MIVFAASIALILGFRKLFNKKKEPSTDDSGYSLDGDEIIDITNVDILSETSSLNLSLDSDHCLMNENEELILYKDYKKARRLLLKQRMSQ